MRAGRAPSRLRSALLELLSGLDVPTSALESEGRAAIDHVVATPDLWFARAGVIPHRDALGRLSDHFGVWAETE